MRKTYIVLLKGNMAPSLIVASAMHTAHLETVAWYCANEWELVHGTQSNSMLFCPEIEQHVKGECSALSRLHHESNQCISDFQQLTLKTHCRGVGVLF